MRVGVKSSGFGVWGSGFGVWNLGFNVSEFPENFRVSVEDESAAGVGVQDSGFRA